MSTSNPKLAAAVQHLQAGRVEQARAGLSRVLQQSPSDVDAVMWMCFLLMQTGEGAQALFYAKRADALRPRSFPILMNLGKSSAMTGDLDGAIDAYTRAYALDADHPSAVVGLTVALNARFRYDESERCCREWLGKHPGQPRLMAQLAVALLQSGQGREAVRVLKEAVALAPDDAILASGLAQTMNYAGDSDPADVLEAHKAYGRIVAKMNPPLPPLTPDLNPDRKLRVGLLSGDFRSHAVGFFAEPIMQYLDRREFELTCFSTIAAEDATTQRLKGHVPNWRNVTNTTDPELVMQIRRDKIDVLVEFSGHTPGQRLAALCLRAAPVQATYFGYPNTTGVPGCDYRIVDSLTDPAMPEFDALATEKLVRLDPCFLCYRPLAGAPEVSPTPALKEGLVTFGSFNNLGKLDDLAVRMYSRVLAAVPRSRLILKYVGLGSAGVRDGIAARFAKEGVTGDRLILDPPGAGAAAMLAAYSRMDVMLDSYPYHGTTTTCEALYMGVPVVTLAGRVCAARVGLSILSAVGLGELVARDEDEYVRIAAGLAGDVPRMTAMRAGLRARMEASPVCDGPGFATRFGIALRAVWRETCTRPG